MTDMAPPNRPQSHDAARIRVFALRRVHGFALIADGFGHIVNLRFGLGLRSAKALAKARNNGR